MATITESLQALIADIEGLIIDASKVDKGQKAAGTRVRKGLQGAKKSCDSIRKEILSLRE